MRRWIASFRCVVLSALFLLPLNADAQETVCIQCHSGQQGRLGEPVAQWQGSFHAQNGVSCFHCHGGDPNDSAMAMSPERGFVGVPPEEEIPDFCGRCHVGVKEDYLRSAHGKALGAGGPTCVTCHGSHAVRRATPELINSEDCARCHEYGRADEIKKAIAETEELAQRLGTSLKSLHLIGIRTGDLEGNLFNIRNQFRRLFHSVDIARIKRETAGYQKSLGEIESRVEELNEEQARRKVWGVVGIALFLAAGVLGLLLHRSYMEDYRP